MNHVGEKKSDMKMKRKKKNTEYLFISQILLCPFPHIPFIYFLHNPSCLGSCVKYAAHVEHLEGKKYGRVNRLLKHDTHLNSQDVLFQHQKVLKRPLSRAECLENSVLQVQSRCPFSRAHVQAFTF